MTSIILVLFFVISSAVFFIASSDMYTLVKLIAVIVLIAAIYIAINRNTYLPFLGTAAMPPILFSHNIVPQGSNVTYSLSFDHKVDDGTIIVYWGSQSSQGGNIIRSNPIEAYGDYSNTGITKVKDNKAVLFFNCPDKYNVGSMFSKTLDRHIHYRLIKPKDPIMSPVYTAFVQC
jgi:hypothetical protein